MSNKIGYLGPEATFTHMAVNHFFPNEIRVPYATIPDCIDAAANGEIDYAVVPLENAIEGSVNITIDYLIHEQPLTIVGEITVPVRQHLLVHPDRAETWKQVRAVYSHPHAIAQCHKFLNSELKGVRTEDMTSTSAAAKFVHENPEQHIAAIANEAAAEKYGLSVVRQDIHTHQNNHTKFIVLHKQQSYLPAKHKPYGEKTTWMITMPSDYAGALYQVLAAFAWRKLNLSKIESRPMKTGLGRYFFLIDVEGSYAEVLQNGAKMELEALGCSVTLLGTYSCFRF
ncbi:prephenate dehydratase [Ectobacillus antri]|jgi:prephenate dehydratase|uniref:Prephenate dehydratase n=1 Tax=Ectobacillus antri TaxID=2486280 RepID=A0ABT6H2Y4_9BACI|nr:prephenate dehydratase [Ectobacillus antri]MDG4655380.1 prephenate dehydratase [Ectobacillus antri]MDG5753138.1 prephenate dehydratase [Ectobacillus antri]